MRRLALLLALVATIALACTPPLPPPRAPVAEIELVESAPIETALNHADIRNAEVVWPEMIDRARETIDLGQFYASDAPDPSTSPLAPTLAALERAVQRDVKVRFLVDQLFAGQYAEALYRLQKIGIEVRLLEAKKRYGGIQHAKYVIVDANECFIGSQNFDWRALRHIQEIGVRVRSASIAGALSDIFDTDWRLASPSAPNDTRSHLHGDRGIAVGGQGEIRLHASPADWLPDPRMADLPRIVELLDAARTNIDVQVLTYSTQMRNKDAFPTLDDALRRAAFRGVKVRLLVSSWGAKPGSHELRSIRSLMVVPNVSVRVLTIPPWSGGEIPFARVAHAKFLVTDRETAWIGTSNWEGDYFLKSRNVAIVNRGVGLPGRLADIFDEDWKISAAPPAFDAPPSSSGPAPP